MYEDKKAKRKTQRAAAIAILLVLEMLAASAAGAITYLILAPIAYRSRGYTALGAEFIASYAVTVIAYLLIHGAIFKDKRKGGRHERNREQRTRKPASGKPHYGDGARSSDRESHPKARMDYIA